MIIKRAASIRARNISLEDHSIPDKQKSKKTRGFGMSGITELVKDENNTTRQVHLISQLEAAN